MSKPMFLWVTRTAPYHLLTAHRLRAMGHRALAVPVLYVRSLPLQNIRQRPDALAFTSANGVRHHQFEPTWRELPVFAVGDHSAKAALRAGYRNVLSADGDVTDLQRLIENALPCPASLIHFSASEPSGDLAATLRQSGYGAERIATYETVPASDVQLEAAIASMPALDGIVAYSPRGARRVAEVIATTGWCGTVFCISHACASQLRHLPGLVLQTAERPTEESLMNLLRLDRSRPPLMLKRCRGRAPAMFFRDAPILSHPREANDNPVETGGLNPREIDGGPEEPGDPPPTAA